jgi:hypothetical protein
MTMFSGVSLQRFESVAVVVVVVVDVAATSK